MKKIIAIVLCLVLMASLSTTAFADELGAGESFEFHQGGESEIHYRLYSSCTISIPATIDFERRAEGEIEVTDANLEKGYAINVYVTNLTDDNSLILEQTDGNHDLHMYFINTDTMSQLSKADNILTSFRDSEIDFLNNHISKCFSYRVETMSLNGTAFAYAGSYTGTMQYEVKIEPYS